MKTKEATNSYSWNYGENESQLYWEVKRGKDYLCTFAHKKHPNVWLGFYIKNGSDVTIMDKKFNDRQRKKDAKNGVGCFGGYPYPTTTKCLSSADVETMKRKVIWAYEHNKTEA